PGKRFSTSPATLKPAPATCPARRTAPLSGSDARGLGRAAAARGCGRGLGAARFVVAAREAFGAGLAFAAAGLAPVLLSLRRPGRERGRLPRTLGSSG